MKTIAFGLAASLLALPAAASQSFTCSAPRCQDVEVPTRPTAPGFTGVGDRHARVLLPVSYATGSSYPVLYLLHGAGDDYTSWTVKGDAEEITRPYDVIVVMPDSGGNANAGWYSDWLQGSPATPTWETFHIYMLIPFIEATFTKALGDGHRAVTGLSMGGFGAMHYAARHPRVFKAAASFSGALDINWGFPVNGVAFSALHSMFGTPTDDIWGSQITNQNNWRANNPADLAANLAGIKLLIATGDGVPGLSNASPPLSSALGCSIGSYEDPGNPAGYALEQGIFQMNLSFLAHLEAAGVAHEDCLYPGGQHSWPYWNDDLRWALPKLLDVIE